MIAVYKPVGAPARRIKVADDFREIQKLVGGVFSGYRVTQFVPAANLRNVMLCCHDEGKLIGLPYNCHIGPEPLVGNILFIAYDDEGNGMDMTKAQVETLCAIL